MKIHINKEPFALITGASSGIGKATAISLAALGKNLIIVARRQERLDKLKQELENSYAIEVITYALDVSDLKAVETFYQTIAEEKIDILINNAGLSRGKESFEKYDFSDWEEMIDINIKGFLKVAQLCIPFLKDTKGHIVNLSSTAGLEAYEGGNVYGGTKSFVQMISKSLRIDLLGTSIRVTDIAPGAVNTEFSTVRFHGDKTKADTVYQGFTELTAEDIADNIVYCVTRPPHVNIESLVVYPTAQASPRIFHKK
ncbi:SDR family NAD(P)-dependent oxidoreductase [bacterium]|nr:SDR family NAD(P)-dependent oxidoreductase [bacterium]NCQ54815.1 SDR family NAD(P)-dependent oxidoreductase [Candidatus Parcubacteria bacterium]NCS66859.1 SDR family NAD(P)-dependent oxidoreductase [Candidatus Peregrinibacteria bacterium]NCS95805.1 SDR family NAD(P)-dependent oxidoreductase [bacterium]